ncbi:MAG TPA: hypothetical protein VGJ91_18480, partial [Polyangiaceae bacterium]
MGSHRGGSGGSAGLSPAGGATNSGGINSGGTNSGGTNDTAGGGEAGEGGEGPGNVCAPDQPACEGNRATTCNANGTGYLAEGLKCSSKQTCLAGACEDQECSP